jgi:hypothetical protein
MRHIGSFLVLTCSLCASALARPIQVAVSGQLVDSSVGRFSHFQDGPVIGGNDTIAFGALTTGGTVSGGPLVYKFTNGTVAPLVAPASAVPGQTGLRFKNTEAPIIAADDTISFGADFDIPVNSFFHDALFVTRGTSLVQLIRTTDPAPGGGTFGVVFPPAAANAQGRAAFISTTGVFHVDSTSATVTRLNTPAVPTLNASGQIAMRGPTSTGTNAIFVGRPGVDLQPRLLEQQQLQDAVVTNLGLPQLNDRAEFVVTGHVRPSGSPNPVGALFVGDVGGDVEIVARQGEPIAAGSALRFGAFYSTNLIAVPVINGQGSVAVIAPLQTVAGAAAGQAFFVREPGGPMRAVATTGQVVVTSAGPFTLATFGTENQVPLNMNARGQSALVAYDGSGKGGLFAYDPEVGLFNIISAGESLTLDDGSTRTVAAVRTCATDWFNSGGEDGRHTCLSAAGTLVYKLTFTDGSSGIFTSTVPEPSASMLVWGALFLCCARRRRSRTLWWGSTSLIDLQAKPVHLLNSRRRRGRG